MSVRGYAYACLSGVARGVVVFAFVVVMVCGVRVYVCAGVCDCADVCCLVDEICYCMVYCCMLCWCDYFVCGVCCISILFLSIIVHLSSVGVWLCGALCCCVGLWPLVFGMWFDLGSLACSICV